MSRLERRYRSALRLLPTSYRAKWEDEMVDAFLESRTNPINHPAYPGRSWPEFASVAALAVRVRLRPVDPSPRHARWLHGARLAVFALMFVHAAQAVSGVAFWAWVLGRPGWLPAPPVMEQIVSLPTDGWHIANLAVPVFWLPAFVSLLYGHRRAAVLFGLSGLLPALAATVAGDLGSPGWAVTSWDFLLLDVAALLTLSVLPTGAPPARRWPWLLGTTLAGLLVLTPLFLFHPTGGPLLLTDDVGVLCLATVAACACHLVITGSRPTARRPDSAAWSTALLLLAVAALAIRLHQNADVLHAAYAWTARMLFGVEVAALAAVLIPLSRRGRANDIPAAGDGVHSP
jgi:hypothetical protein